jgi:ribonucleotide reductase alpha subunit
LHVAQAAASSCLKPSSCGWPWACPSTKSTAKARAIEFYEVLSSFDFMSSTPTLFNSGTLRSQLSSCYLTTVPDDLDGIYDVHQRKCPAV